MLASILERPAAAGIAAALLVAAPLVHGPLAADDEGALGSLSFPVSCKAEVRADFERAVALLHHMTYQQALESFEAVAARDPRCAMAHWGVAMSLFQPLWPNRPTGEQLQRGWQAVERATALEPPTDRESLYVAAAAEFFRDFETLDHWQRIERWERGQEALYQAFPDDSNTAAFYALAHLARAPLAERPLDHYERAARILLEVHRNEPTHPGAVHYLIHANDVEDRARERLEIVRSYGEIAPDNPHALHMPTHIFVRLGFWQEVIDWNRRAAEAALAHPAGERGEYVSDEYPHALEYLVYAALQLGEKATAVESWEKLRRTEKLQPTFKTAFHLASIPARLALESHAWQEAAGLRPREPASVEWDLFPWPEAITWFARGLGSARIGNLTAARDAAANIARLRDQARERGEQPFAHEIEILRLELEAWIVFGAGDSDGAIELLRSAVDLEQALPKQPVTPAPTLPPSELLADLLLELGRPEEALEIYERTLRSTPGRRNSLEGAASARARP